MILMAKLGMNQQSSHVFFVLMVNFEYKRSKEHISMSGRQVAAATWTSGAREGGSMKLEVFPEGGGRNGTGVDEAIVSSKILVARR